MKRDKRVVTRYSTFLFFALVIGFIIALIFVTPSLTGNITANPLANADLYETLIINKSYTSQLEPYVVSFPLNNSLDALLVSGQLRGTGAVEIFLFNETDEWLVYAYTSNGEASSLTGMVTGSNMTTSLLANTSSQNNSSMVVSLNDEPDSVFSEIKNVSNVSTTASANDALHDGLVNETNVVDTDEFVVLPVREDNHSTDNQTLNDSLANTTTSQEDFNKSVDKDKDVVDENADADQEDKEENKDKDKHNDKDTDADQEDVASKQNENWLGSNSSENKQDAVFSIVPFSLECEETCELDGVYANQLRMKVSGNLELFLKEVAVSTRQEAAQFLFIPDTVISLNDSFVLDIYEYFPFNENIIFDTPSVEGLSLSIKDNRYLVVSPEKTGTFSLFMYATDGDVLKRSNEFAIEVVVDDDVQIEIIQEPIVTPNVSLVNTSLAMTSLVLAQDIVAVARADMYKLDSAVLDSLQEKSSVRVLLKTNQATFLQVDATASPNKKEWYNPFDASAITKKDVQDIAKELNTSKKIINDALYLNIASGEPIVVKQIVTQDVVAIELSAAALADLLASDMILEVSEDKPMNILTTESLNLTNISVAHDDYGLSGSGVAICVLDTGANPSVLGLTNGSDVFGYNFVDDTADYSDVHGHGTKVLYPLVQTAPDATYFVGKVISDTGVGYSSDVAAGLQWCADNNADVISLSIGEGSYEGFCVDDIVADKVNELVDAGIVVVAATGNDGSTTAIANPACAEHALRVAASTKTDELWSNSNYNNITLLLAPGGGIQTLDEMGSAVFASGTSMSVPFVSGSVALLVEDDSSLTPNATKWKLIHSGMVINTSANDYSFARINLANALANIVTNNLSEGILGNQTETNGSFNPYLYSCSLSLRYRCSAAYVIWSSAPSTSAQCEAWCEAQDATGYSCCQFLGGTCGMSSSSTTYTGNVGDSAGYCSWTGYSNGYSCSIDSDCNSDNCQYRQVSPNDIITVFSGSSSDIVCCDEDDCVYGGTCYDPDTASSDHTGWGVEVYSNPAGTGGDNDQVVCNEWGASDARWGNLDYAKSWCESGTGTAWNLGYGDADVEGSYYTAYSSATRPTYCKASNATTLTPSVDCCCGDDDGEYVRGGDTGGVGYESLDGDTACCDSDTDCVDASGNCRAPGYDAGSYVCNSTGGVWLKDEGQSCSVDGDCYSNDNCVTAINSASKYCAPVGDECSRSGYAGGYDTGQTYDAGTTIWICLGDDLGGMACADAGTNNCDETAASSAINYYCSTGTWVSGADSAGLDAGCGVCYVCSVGTGTGPSCSAYVSAYTTDAGECTGSTGCEGSDCVCDGSGNCDINNGDTCAGDSQCVSGDCNTQPDNTWACTLSSDECADVAGTGRDIGYSVCVGTSDFTCARESIYSGTDGWDSVSCTNTCQSDGDGTYSDKEATCSSAACDALTSCNAGYACNGAASKTDGNDCATSCASNDDDYCADGYTCEGTSCVDTLDDGSTTVCDEDSDCTNDNCVTAINSASKYCAPSGRECSRSGYATGYDTGDVYSNYICLGYDDGGQLGNVACEIAPTDAGSYYWLSASGWSSGTGSGVSCSSTDNCFGESRYTDYACDGSGSCTQPGTAYTNGCSSETVLNAYECTAGSWSQVGATYCCENAASGTAVVSDPCSGKSSACINSRTCANGADSCDFTASAAESGCGDVDCSGYIYGWVGNTCQPYGTSAGYCDAAGTCDTSADPTSCNVAPVGSGGPTCGSAGCVDSSSCLIGGPTSAYDEISEVCHVDGAQHGCSAGQVCDATGTCVDTSAPTFGDVSISGHDYLSGSTYWAQAGTTFTVSYPGYDTYSINSGDHYLRAYNGTHEARINGFLNGVVDNNEWITNSHINLNGGGAPSIVTQSSGTLEIAYYPTMSTNNAQFPLYGYLRDDANNVNGYDRLNDGSGDVTLACDNDGPSDPNVTVTGVTDDSVSLSWTVADDESGIDYIRLYFQKSPYVDAGDQIDIDGCGGTVEYSLPVGTASSYTIDCLEGNQDYRYYIRAYDNVGLTTNDGYYTVTTECGAHSDCASGEYCSAAGSCIAQISTEGTACSDAAVIDSDSDRMCSDTTYARSCFSGSNQYCQGTGAAATGGECRRNNGESCSTGDECGSGVCASGTCRAANGGVCNSPGGCGSETCSADDNNWNSGDGQWGGPANSGCATNMPIDEYTANFADCTVIGSGIGNWNRDSDCDENCVGDNVTINSGGPVYPYWYGYCITLRTYGQSCCQARGGGSGGSGGGDCAANLDCYGVSGATAGVCRKVNDQTCDNGDECFSDLCIGGTCQSACDGTNDGQGCSSTSTSYTTYGTCAGQNGGSYVCDTTDEVAYDPTVYETLCSNAAYSDSCMSSAGGLFSADGVCGSTSNAACCTQFADGTSSDNRPLACTAGNSYAPSREYCDYVGDGSWDTGTTAGTNKFRTDASDNKCVACDANNKEYAVTNLGTSDGFCEYGCGANIYCDEHASGYDIGRCDQTGQSYYEDECTSTCGLQDVTTCEATGTGCTASSECDENNINTCANNGGLDATTPYGYCSTCTVQAATASENACKCATCGTDNSGVPTCTINPWSASNWAGSQGGDVCCGDESAENARYRNEYASWTDQFSWNDDTTDTACCSSTELCTYGGNCYTVGPKDLDSVGGREAYCHSSGGGWLNTDYHESYCDDYYGDDAWNVGNGDAIGDNWTPVNGNTVDQNYCNARQATEGGNFVASLHCCCGDDENENRNSQVCSGVTDCATTPTDDACCDASTDCVEAGVCYTHYPDGLADSSDTSVDFGDEWGTCVSGTWVDPDVVEARCTEINNHASGTATWIVAGEICGEYSDTTTSACCGDDDGENYINCVAETNAKFPDTGTCDSSDAACCDASSDCVTADDQTCVTNATTHDGDGDGDLDYCLDGEWHDCADDSHCASDEICVGDDFNSEGHCSYEYLCRDVDFEAPGGTLDIGEWAYYVDLDGSAAGFSCGDHAFTVPATPSGNFCVRFDILDGDSHSIVAGTSLNHDTNEYFPASTNTDNNNWDANFVYDYDDSTSNFIQAEPREWETGIALFFGNYISEAGDTDSASSQSGCCDDATDCVYDANILRNVTPASRSGFTENDYGCYDQTTLLETGYGDGGNDDSAEYCGASNTWYAADEDGTACSAAGGVWGSSGITGGDVADAPFGGYIVGSETECCGDDAGENYRGSASGGDGYQSLVGGTYACCDASTDCVDDSGNCVSNTGTHSYTGVWWECQSGVWVDVGCTASTNCAAAQYCDTTTHVCTAIATPSITASAQDDWVLNGRLGGVDVDWSGTLPSPTDLSYEYHVEMTLPSSSTLYDGSSTSYDHSSLEDNVRYCYRARIENTGTVTHYGSWTSNVCNVTLDRTGFKADYPAITLDPQNSASNRIDVGWNDLNVSAAGNDDSPRDRYVKVNGTIQHTTSRSYALCSMTDSWGVSSCTNYDVYGSTAARDSMVTAINSLSAGQNVVVTTYDEPANNLPGSLATALESLGASTEALASMQTRGSYILLGQKGLSEGTAFSESQGMRYGSSIYETFDYQIFRANSLSSTFEPVGGYFDDFSDGDYTNNVAWTAHYATLDASNGYLNLTASDSSYESRAYTSINLPPDVVVEFDAYVQTGDYMMWGFAATPYTFSNGQPTSGVRHWTDIDDPSFPMSDIREYGEPDGVFDIKDATNMPHSIDINEDEWVHYKIIKKGSNYKFFASDILVYEAIDDTFADSTLRFFVGSNTNGTNAEIYFDNVRVSPLVSTDSYEDTDATDNAQPVAPSGLGSSSHTVSTWSGDTTIDATWTDASDSGDDYFYYMYGVDSMGNINSFDYDTFETSYSGWYPRTDLTISRQTTYSHGGSYSLRAYDDATDGQFQFYKNYGSTLQDESTDFVAVAYVYLPTAGDLTGVRLQYRDGGSNFYTGGTTYDTNYYTDLDQWVRIELPFTADASSGNGFLTFQATGSEVDDYMFVDDVRVYKRVDDTITSGLDGYATSFTSGASDISSTTKDVENSAQSKTSSSLSSGQNYYFNIKSVDNANNWDVAADTAHYGPFWVCADSAGVVDSDGDDPSGTVSLTDADTTCGCSAQDITDSDACDSDVDGTADGVCSAGGVCAVPSPVGKQFKVDDNSGASTLLIDESGDVFIGGLVYDSQGSLTPPANSFIVKNNAGTVVSYVSSSGDLYLLGQYYAQSAMSPTGSNLLVKNTTGTVAYFDDAGNLRLNGALITGYSE
ncbi:S8 family serine peptidase [Candidatus Woesearchaeota archaeon]|nr:S8 family serine peptidase [Candidatus Woesearchaeota archaeon]